MVLLDLWHWLDRWSACLAVPLGHQRRTRFFRMITDAVLSPDADDFKSQIDQSQDDDKLISDAKEWMDPDLHHIYSRRCRRRPNSKEKIFENVIAVINYFVGSIDNRAKNAKMLKKVQETTKSNCDSCAEMSGVVAKCDRCMWDLCDVTFKYHGEDSIWKVLRKQMKHVSNGCLSVPKDFPLHCANRSGHIFKNDGTGHNECGHRRLIVAFKGANYSPLKVHQLLLRRMVEENESAAKRRDIPFPISKPLNVFLNSAVSQFTDDIRDLPFNRITPFTSHSFPIGIDIISPVESDAVEKHLIKHNKVQRAIKKAVMPFHHEMETTELSDVLFRAIGKDPEESFRTVAQNLTTDQTLHQFATRFKCNIGIITTSGENPSLVAETKVASRENAKDIFLLKKCGSNFSARFTALNVGVIKEALYGEFNSTDDQVKDLKEKSCAKCTDDFDGNAAFQTLQRRSKSFLPLPIPFVRTMAPTDETKLFLSLGKEYTLDKATETTWKKFASRYNDLVAENQSSRLNGRPFLKLTSKLWKHMRDYHVWRLRQTLPKVEDNLDISETEEYKKVVELLYSHPQHVSPKRAAPESKPAPVPPSFPSLGSNYQGFLPGVQLTNMPCLKTPHVTKTPLAPYAPLQMDSSNIQAQILRDDPNSWISWKKICAKCNHPNKGHHTFNTQGGVRQKICNSAKVKVDLMSYKGTEYDKRSYPQKKYKSFGTMYNKNLKMSEKTRHTGKRKRYRSGKENDSTHIAQASKRNKRTKEKTESFACPTILVKEPRSQFQFCQTWDSFAKQRGAILRVHVCDYLNNATLAGEIISWFRFTFGEFLNLTIDSSFRQLTNACGILCAASASDMANPSHDLWYKTAERGTIEKFNTPEKIQFYHELLLRKSQGHNALATNIDRNHLDRAVFLKATQVEEILKHLHKAIGRSKFTRHTEILRILGDPRTVRDQVVEYVSHLIKGHTKVKLPPRIVIPFNNEVSDQSNGLHWLTVGVSVDLKS